ACEAGRTRGPRPPGVGRVPPARRPARCCRARPGPSAGRACQQWCRRGGRGRRGAPRTPPADECRPACSAAASLVPLPLGPFGAGIVDAEPPGAAESIREHQSDQVAEGLAANHGEWSSLLEPPHREAKARPFVTGLLHFLTSPSPWRRATPGDASE